MSAPNCWRCRTLPGTCLEHSSFLPMTAPKLLELAKVAGTVEDVIVAEIVEDGGELNCADGEEGSHIIYQLASEVMVHRAVALSEADRVTLRETVEALSILVDRYEAETERPVGDGTQRRVRAAYDLLDRLLGRSAT